MPHSLEIIKDRIRIDLSVIIAGFLVILGLLLLAYQQHRQEEDNQWVVHTYQVMDHVKAVEALLVDAETGARGYAATQDSVFLEPYRQARSQIESNLGTLPQLVADNPAQQRRVRQLNQLAKAKVAIVDRIVRTKPLPASPASHTLFQQGKQRMDAVRQHVRSMTAVEQALLKTRQQRAQNANRYTLGLTGLIGGLALLAFWQAYGLIQQSLTRRLQAQVVARQSADLLRAVIHNVPTGLVLYQAVRDSAGEIIDFIYTLSNPVNDRVAGRQADELFQVSLLAHSPVTRTNGVYEDLVQVVRSGQPLSRLRHFQSDRVQGWFDSRYVKQEDGVLVSFLDVTALKEAQLTQQQQAQALERANQELQRSNASLQSFAFVASHDLQEPLRKIEAFGNLLVELYAKELDEQGANYLQRMQVAARRMAHLIRALLSYARLGNAPTVVAPVSMSGLVDEILDDLETAITRSGVQITVGELPTLPGEVTQLRQLLQNLISNAIKFSQKPGGGLAQVTISSRLVAGGELPAGAPTAVPGAYWEIGVSDNGIGFDVQYLDRIFEAFQRLHSDKQFSGSGIGLAICKRVVENHGGWITADSQPGEGATFRVYLPEGGASPARSEEPPE
ncbi:sensor histidine kinase [Spirosoma utsteinense]|uniref:histidine kinase n=1 Tax=Spirosoma utsteinense TaxID=2585773 RepID=A0ABR6W9K2_9BACT|nr:sensor histidine kinase [Spirosoma utsteinense]MBC3789033.1 signal transduction histidine kinase [Spirosoma utsteinense]MBC3792641.1 signal transduction histidine kinase [Spirosoma utsteinense]